MASTDISQRLAVVCDPLEEGWPSMDLVADSLLDQLSRLGVAATRIRPPLPRLARSLPGVGGTRAALNADRLVGRYLIYPGRLWLSRSRFDALHVVDHSYAQLVHMFPRGRAGVFCHDLDTFRCLLHPQLEPRPPWFRALVRVTLEGLRRAAVVFHSTNVVRQDILRHGLVVPERLVHAPYGVAPEFHPGPAGGLPEAVQSAIGSRPFVLHVGSALARKRLDILFEVFARLRARYPDLRLVQQGAQLDPGLRARVERLGLQDALVQPSPLPRLQLAALYRRAAAVLVPSEAEGFGLPVLEALACGTPVVASDLPVLREVGSGAVLYCPVGDVPAWTAVVDAVLGGSPSVPNQVVRLSRAAAFSWQAHADAVLQGYRCLGVLP